jgi:hypothetical protein
MSDNDRMTLRPSRESRHALAFYAKKDILDRADIRSASYAIRI